MRREQVRHVHGADFWYVQSVSLDRVPGWIVKVLTPQSDGTFKKAPTMEAQKSNVMLQLDETTSVSVEVVVLVLTAEAKDSLNPNVDPAAEGPNLLELTRAAFPEEVRPQRKKEGVDDPAYLQDR